MRLSICAFSMKKISKVAKGLCFLGPGFERVLATLATSKALSVCAGLDIAVATLASSAWVEVAKGLCFLSP